MTASPCLGCFVGLPSTAAHATCGALHPCRWAAEEERELTARRLRLLVYLLRDPLFARYTQASRLWLLL